MLPRQQLRQEGLAGRRVYRLDCRHDEEEDERLPEGDQVKDDEDRQYAEQREGRALRDNEQRAPLHAVRQRASPHAEQQHAGPPRHAQHAEKGD